jgi:hypothetical protein
VRARRCSLCSRRFRWIAWLLRRLLSSSAADTHANGSPRRLCAGRGWRREMVTGNQSSHTIRMRERLYSAVHQSRVLASSSPRGEHREVCRSASRPSPALVILFCRATSAPQTVGGPHSPRSRTFTHLASERLRDGVVVVVDRAGSETRWPLRDRLLRAHAPDRWKAGDRLRP